MCLALSGKRNKMHFVGGLVVGRDRNERDQMGEGRTKESTRKDDQNRQHLKGMLETCGKGNFLESMRVTFAKTPIRGG